MTTTIDPTTMTAETVETSTETATETEIAQPIEDEHVWTSRVASELAAAEASAEACRAIEAEKFAAVDRARGDHALGMVDRGTWLKAARALSQSQENTAAADSKVRAVEREHARQAAPVVAVPF